MPCREVRADGDRPIGPPFVPTGALLAHPAEHPRADVDDQPGVLGHVDEPIRVPDLARRVVPAQQGLRGGDGTVDDRHLGLVPDVQVVVADGVTELRLDLDPTAGGIAQFVVEHADRVAARVLGCVHGGICMHDQVAVGRVVLGGGDADADGRVQIGAGDRDGSAERLNDPPCALERVARSVQIAHHDDELVAARPDDQVAATNGVAQAIGCGADQVVAGAMAERVVDELEAVEIHHQHGDVPVRSSCRRQRSFEFTVEFEPVRKTGELVVGRLLLQVFLGANSIRDVGDL